MKDTSSSSFAKEASSVLAFSTRHHTPSSHQATNLWTAEQDQHLGGTTHARSPRKPLVSEFGQVNNTTARLAHASVAQLLQLLEQEQTPVSPGGAHSLGQSIPAFKVLSALQGHQFTTTELSPQSSFHTLELLKVTLGITVQGKTREKQSKLVYFGPLATVCVWPLQFPR